jgi:hypothetical protein
MAKHGKGDLMSVSAQSLNTCRAWAKNAAWPGEYLSHMDAMRAIAGRIIAGDYS